DNMNVVESFLLEGIPDVCTWKLEALFIWHVLNQGCIHVCGSWILVCLKLRMLSGGGYGV
ncbi:hypothetical protein A2U01_0062162, partial [Trifolium medium]|nr:hypothetical protein [Trifolium medium]